MSILLFDKPFAFAANKFYKDAVGRLEQAIASPMYRGGKSIRPRDQKFVTNRKNVTCSVVLSSEIISASIFIDGVIVYKCIYYGVMKQMLHGKCFLANLGYLISKIFWGALSPL